MTCPGPNELPGPGGKDRGGKVLAALDENSGPPGGMTGVGGCTPWGSKGAILDIPLTGGDLTLSSENRGDIARDGEVARIGGLEVVLDGPDAEG